MKPVQRARRRLQAGLSIVELMIAVAIALFLLAGFATSFLRLKSVFTSQDRLSTLHDDERLALTQLAATVRAAGYYPDPIAQTAAQALPAAATPHGGFVDGQGLVGTGSGSSGQTLTTRYVMGVGDTLADCLGRPNRAPTPALVSNTYSVGAGGALMCSLDGGATQTAVVGNVQSFSVLHGTDSQGLGAIDRYLSADEVSAAGLWPAVRSVRMVVSFRNPYAGAPGQPATLDWVQTVNLMNRK